jgi:hypothetical protein
MGKKASKAWIGSRDSLSRIGMVECASDECSGASTNKRDHGFERDGFKV